VRCGRDPHDGIIQSIYAAGLHLEEVSAAIGQGHDGATDRLSTVMAELNRISGDIRAYVFDLRSASLDTLDAEEIVASVADELRANSLVELAMRVDCDQRPSLDGEQAEQLRHIVQEAFSNVLRHAQARRVSVRLGCTRRQLTLEIRDDGVGFDPERAAATGPAPNPERQPHQHPPAPPPTPPPAPARAPPAGPPPHPGSRRMSVPELPTSSSPPVASSGARRPTPRTSSVPPVSSSTAAPTFIRAAIVERVSRESR
jgi:hypothetical protein